MLVVLTLCHMHFQSCLYMKVWLPRFCSHLSADDPCLLDVTVYCWVKGSHHVKGLCVSLNSFETSETTHPITQHHIWEKLDFCGWVPWEEGAWWDCFMWRQSYPVAYNVHSTGLLFLLDCFTWWNCTFEIKIALCIAIWMHTVRAVM
jgi:hypothetical protein